MLFFLTSIAVVLIATGGAAALYGADTIRSESGATIAVAGVSVACAGFLLLGLVQVCVELRRLRRAVEEDATALPAPKALPPLPLAGDKPAESLPPRGADAAPGERVEPSLSSAPLARADITGAAAAAPDRTKSATERDLDADLDGGLEAEAEEAVDADLLAAGGDKPPEQAAAVPVPAEPTRERGDPVATYTSGGNTYFMYGDGTIEADTPKGRYRFATMAELRHYAETGEGGVLLKTAEEPEPRADKPVPRVETITI